jgi:hypothetical protein
MNVAIILYLLLTLSSTILFATQLWQANRDRTMNNSRVIRRLRTSAASMFALHLASAFFNYGGQPWQLPLGPQRHHRRLRCHLVHREPQPAARLPDR